MRARAPAVPSGERVPRDGQSGARGGGVRRALRGPHDGGLRPARRVDQRGRDALRYGPARPLRRSADSDVRRGRRVAGDERGDDARAELRRGHQRLHESCL